MPRLAGLKGQEKTDIENSVFPSNVYVTCSITEKPSRHDVIARRTLCFDPIPARERHVPTISVPREISSFKQLP